MTLRLMVGGLIASLCLSLPASAQVVDGTRAGDDYGAALSVQTVTTGFGDNESEWNAAYGTIADGALSLMFTGNLQASFNKLEVFIDTAPGGSNVLDTIGNDNAGNMNGMTLDDGFAPEYHFIFRNGNFEGDHFDVDMATLNSGAFGPGSLIIDGNSGGNGADIFGGSLQGVANDIGGTSLDVGFDNSNAAGIAGCDTANDSPPNCPAADQDAARAVETGLEMSIDLADIGNPAGPVRVMLLQNNDNHSFLSNQSLGGLPAGTGNLGSSFYTDGNAGLANFNDFAGDQFFTVPEPGTLALVCLGLIGILARRR